MTGNRSLLTEVREATGPTVTFADNSKGRTVGYGKYKVGRIIIEEIALVEGLQHNLLSVSQFCDKGYYVHFEKEICIIKHTKDKRPSLCGIRKGNIFVADLSTGPGNEYHCFYAKASSEDSQLWHKKLSHLNFKTINSLVKRDLVRGLPSLEFTSDDLCEACQKGKAKRASHKSKTINSITEPLHLLHMDLFGPVNITSIDGGRYALVIVDDFSKFTWVYFLASKDETPLTVIDHIKLVELEKGVPVKAVRSDNGTEFKNQTLINFYSDKGINRQYSAPRTPQQNGVVERKNRTLIEAARTMIAEAKLPLYFWAVAVSTACYTQNRTLINKDHT